MIDPTMPGDVRLSGNYQRAQSLAISAAEAARTAKREAKVAEK